MEGSSLVTIDPHRGPVPASAWTADARARERGRVEMFNATRPSGLNGWRMDLGQYELVAVFILDQLDDAGPHGVLLKDLVEVVQQQFGAHPAFPGGRLRNYCTFVKVDLEARQQVERIPTNGPQRLRRG